MSNMRKVHQHLADAARAHRDSHEEALRAAAVARAQLEAANATTGPTGADPATVAPGGSDDAD